MAVGALSGFATGCDVKRRCRPPLFSPKRHRIPDAGQGRNRGAIFWEAMLTTAFSILMLTAIQATNAPDYRQVAVYGGLVTLDVPADWNEIPPDVLEFYSLRAAETSGGRMAEFYQHGFRPDDPEIDFSLPQFLIQIRESGRLNYRQFLRLPSAEDMRAAGERSLTEHVGPMVSEMEMGGAEFDPETYTLRLDNILNLRLEGDTSVTSVAFLTQRGLFTIHFYARVSESALVEQVFEHIAGSVRIDDQLKYRPRLADHWPPRPISLFSVAALILVIVVSIHRFRRRHNQS
jgi:hypothetical protein